MRKKYYYLFIIIVAFNLIFYPFLGVEAKENKEQPEVCNGPSKTMGMYFQFQNEMMSAMLGSEINEKRFVTTKTDGGLFKEKFLTLGTGSINALDIVATSIRGSMQSAGSSITTLTVLLSLATLSVGQSNTEGLRILTKDRVIVREYKKLLDIESSLMELTYFFSQRMNLVASFDGNLVENVKSVIKKHQELGLLEETNNLDRLNGVTIADIMSELIMMNAYMKHFVLFNAGLGDFQPSIMPNFSGGAIDQLKDDYSGLGVLGACNQYASNFKSTISKGLKNNVDSLNNAMNDVKSATKRLGAVFGGSSSSEDSSRCDMSQYEMSQLRAYRGGNWTCKSWLINGNVVAPLQELAMEQKAKKTQKESTTNNNISELTKEEKRRIKEEEKKKKQEEKEAKKKEKQEIKKQKEEIKKLREDLKNSRENDEKQKIWRNLFGSGATFDILGYSGGFNSELGEMYSDLMSNYKQSQENAMSSDVSYELVNIKALLDQVDDTSAIMDELKNPLNDIVKYQCKRKFY